MASKPFLDKRRGSWWMKTKPDPLKGWVKVKLGPHGSPYPPDKPPKKPPKHVVDRAAELADIEWRAKMGLATGKSKETGLAAYILAYLEIFKQNRKAGSLENLTRFTATFSVFAEGKGVRSVEGVNKKIVREYLEHRGASLSPNSLKTERGYLSPIWSQAVQDELIAANPWTLVKVTGKIAPSDPVFWTAEQVDAIVKACKRPWFGDLVLVLANTGIRISAMLAMRWDWIEWQAGIITIPREHDKGGKGYRVALSSVARDTLSRRLALSGTDLVFPSSGGGSWSYAHVRNSFDSAVASAGVPVGTLHDLRHTFGRSLAAVAPINVVQASLGHSSLAMTQRYTSVGGEAGVGVMKKFGVGTAKEPE